MNTRNICFYGEIKKKNNNNIYPMFLFIWSYGESEPGFLMSCFTNIRTVVGSKSDRSEQKKKTKKKTKKTKKKQNKKNNKKTKKKPNKKTKNKKKKKNKKKNSI